MLQFYGLQHAMCHSSKIMSFRVIWKHIKLKSSQLQCGVYHIGMNQRGKERVHSFSICSSMCNWVSYIQRSHTRKLVSCVSIFLFIRVFFFLPSHTFPDTFYHSHLCSCSLPGACYTLIFVLSSLRPALAIPAPQAWKLHQLLEIQVC